MHYWSISSWWWWAVVKYAATCECVLWKTVESLKRSPAIDEIEYKHGMIA